MAKAAKKPTPKPEIEIFEDLEQGSPEWFQARLGLLTASNLAVAMRSGRDGGESKTRQELLYTLAGEIVTGVPAENYKSAAMQRGNDMEQSAREHYEKVLRMNDMAAIRRVGFIKHTLPNGIVIGCSPDSLVDHDGALEIKTMMPKLLIARLMNGGGPPPEYRAQIHGTAWVANLQWVDLVLFYRGADDSKSLSQKFRIDRDDNFIREISDEVERFDYELKRIVEKIRAMGGRA